MANVLDLRRRIRSVKNTRQITKAMKMVSAAKLRRAQERALAARPYARMITSVLESLTPPRRSLRPENRQPVPPALCHPRRKARPAHRRQRRQGLCRRIQRQHPQDRLPVHRRQPDREIDIEAIGRKGRDQMRRRYPSGCLCRADRRRRQHPPGPWRAQGPRRSHRRPSRHARQARDRHAYSNWRTASSPATFTRRSTPPTSSTTNSSP